MRPRLVAKVIGKDGKVRLQAPEMLRKLPWNPENVEFLRKSLAGVVNDYGTGGAAKLPGIVVGGKTGTAQVASVKGRWSSPRIFRTRSATTRGSSRSPRWTTRRSSWRPWWSTAGTADPPPRRS